MQLEIILVALVMGSSLATGSYYHDAEQHNPSLLLLQRHRRATIVKDPVLDHELIEYNDCEELTTLCAHLKATDNLSILECISTFTSSQVEALSDKCQHAVWLQQRKMLTATWLQEQLIPKHCPGQSGELSACANSVDMWACVRGRIELLDRSNLCRVYMHRVLATFLPDYDSLADFFASCSTEVEQLGCGRLHVPDKSISQTKTAQCLQETGADVLGPSCKVVVARIEQHRSELLFFEICSSDVQRLCGQHLPNSPAAFKCLVKNKNSLTMSRLCADEITKRDRAIARDYRQSHGLAKACKDDIKLYHCRRGVSEDRQVRLAQILLCLESVAKNNSRVTVECRAEIDDHRRMLMQDYHLYPEIIADCAYDIPKFCRDVEKHQAMASNFATNGKSVDGTGGDVIHCLMDYARVNHRKEGRVTAQCQRSLETLLKISDAGEDWRVDPVLRRACKPVVDMVCRDTDGGEARVMSCLMEHIKMPVMRSECEQALMLIQYFVARDFKLDPQLYKHCRDDAVKYCRAKRAWDDAADVQMDPERGPLILPCLHRIAYSEDSKVVLHKECFKEVRRVMRQRAVSVDLIPEVEDVCIDDLSLYCSDRIEKGAEMECLQTNMDNLQAACKTAVSTYTEEEAAHVELNPVIMSVCADAMSTLCSHILKSGSDKGDMMDCLISHKNDADLRQDLKCRAAIEHFQIISLKNYHFTYKFKEACRPYVVRFCTASTTKNEVVGCLSEVMRNDTIRGKRHSIPKECRQQVKAQLYQQHESLAFDPKLAQACKKEMDKFCTNERGQGQAIECLIANTVNLGHACHHAIFLVKKSELSDSGTDYTLVNTCKEMTFKYCSNSDSTHLLECLKTYKDDVNFDTRCHLVVVNRMIEQNTDYRFNPQLQSACGKNIDQYCSDVVVVAKPNEELNGLVIQCLKNKFRESRLDPGCAQKMIKILQEQALNYKLNPLLQNFCKSEIQVLCKEHLDAEDQGDVEECLKDAFLKQKIINRHCKMEVATLIAEAKADIHVDPLLEDACTVDLLRFCSKIKSGNGRKLKCLQDILQGESKALEENCRSKLEQRIEMFFNADTVLAQPPENVEQLVQQVVTSPAKRFFIVILMTAVGMVFVLGIFLGRLTRRAMNLKNK